MSGHLRRKSRLQVSSFPKLKSALMQAATKVLPRLIFATDGSSQTDMGAYAITMADPAVTLAGTMEKIRQPLRWSFWP